ncbi:MAG: ubiquinone/menaquinone biosynthesis methyltransferase [bacterium]
MKEIQDMKYSKNTKKLSLMFDKIAFKYDLINKILSFGLDSKWRQKLKNEVKIIPNMKILDIGTGTGKTAKEFLEKNALIVGIDISELMLKIAKKNYSKISFIKTDCLNLSFKENCFDLITMTFCLRNVENIENALKEINKVIKKSGFFYLLGLINPTCKIIKILYFFYLLFIVPIVSKLFRGSFRSYLGLYQSIKNFPNSIVLKTLFEKSGFKEVEMVPLFFGTVHLIKARK